MTDQTAACPPVLPAGKIRKPGGPGGPPADDTRESLVAAAREVAARAGTQHLTISTFRGKTGIGHRRIYRHFESWRELCRAAGLKVWTQNGRVPDDAIFQDIMDAFLAVGGIATRRQIAGRLAWGPSVANRRWGTWAGTLAAFRDWVEAEAPDFQFREELERRVIKLAGQRQPERESPLGPPWPALGGRAAGAPLGFRAMTFAPANEMGVVLLFGMVAGELGYAIDTVQPGFPDATAKRRTGPARWESVRIEFEYRSRSFRDHGHDAHACDVIVCWAHDWPDCPLEVLCLKDAIAAL